MFSYLCVCVCVGLKGKSGKVITLENVETEFVVWLCKRENCTDLMRNFVGGFIQRIIMPCVVHTLTSRFPE